MRQTTHMLMGAMMLPLPAMAADFGLKDCKALFAISGNDKKSLCLYQTHDVAGTGVKAKIYENNQFTDAVDGSYSTHALGAFYERFRVYLGDVYVDDNSVLLNNGVRMIFSMDGDGVQKPLLCDVRAQACTQAPDKEYISKRGTKIPVTDGRISSPHEAASIICNFESVYGEEKIECEDRD